MEELTRERAHDLCCEMWNAIAENGYTDKAETYLIEKYTPEDDCFSCEHYFKQGHGLCAECPFSMYDGGCEGESSPYANWYSGISRKQNAIAIADLFID